MSKRYRIAAIAFGLILLAGSGQAQEEAQDSQGQAAQQQNPARSLPLPFPVDIVEDEAAAEARQRREQEADQREIDDLAAQQGMNAATQAMNEATQRMALYNLISTALVGLGTALLIVTLYQTRQANKAARDAVKVAKESNDLIRREQRPWVTIADVGFSLVWTMQYSSPESAPKDFTHYGGAVKWKLLNSGSQPAQNIMVETEFFDRFVAADGPMPFKEVKGLYWSDKNGKSAVELGARNALKAVTERLDSFPHRKRFLSPDQAEIFDATGRAFFFKSLKERGRPLAEGDKRAVLICVSYTSLDAAAVFRTYGVYEVVVIDHPLATTSDLPAENVKSGRFGLRQISGEMT